MGLRSLLVADKKVVVNWLCKTMLPVKYRIKKELLPLVLKQNKVFSSSNLNLRVHNRANIEVNFNKSPRLAIIISKKVSHLAVTRHFVKRRISSILEKIWTTLPNSLDIIVQVKKDVSKIDFSVFEKEILGLLITAKILK